MTGTGDPGEAAASARARRRRVVGAAAGMLVVLVLAFIVWYELEAYALGPEGPPVVLTVHDGEPVNSIVSNLSDLHVIGSSLAFRISDIVDGTPTVVPGDYSFHENQTFAEVRAILDGGPNVYLVDVRAGLTLREVAQRVDDFPGHGATSFAHIAASGVVHSVFSPPGSNNLEGMLGSGIYRVFPGQSDTTILTEMVRRFDRQATAAGINTGAGSAFSPSAYQLITAASVVEKEGYIPKNMPDVARVIDNRVAADMALQMDSTVLYALGQDGGPVTPQDLQIVSPYNSYLNKGLPPTPICTPSPEALAAAVHPPPGHWLYFVLVDKDGTEAFADTFAQQLANEKLAHSRGVG
jgi:UPF0755 protein